MGLCNIAEPTAADIRVWIIEIDLVEDIEELGTELYINLLSDLVALEEPHIPTEQLGTVKGSSSNSAKRPNIVDGESSLVEPDGLVRTGRWIEADSGEFCPITLDPSAGVI